MKVREFLETLAINNYFAISINELVDSKEYSSGELSIVVYDTDIDFVWRIKRRDLGMQRNENLYKIWKAEYDN